VGIEDSERLMIGLRSAIPIYGNGNSLRSLRSGDARMMDVAVESWRGMRGRIDGGNTRKGMDEREAVREEEDGGANKVGQPYTRLFAAQDLFSREKHIPARRQEKISPGHSDNITHGPITS